MAHKLFNRVEAARVQRVVTFAFVANRTRKQQTAFLPFLYSYVDWQLLSFCEERIRVYNFFAALTNDVSDFVAVQEIFDGA